MKARKKSADEKIHDKFREDVNKALSPVVSKYFKLKNGSLHLRVVSVTMNNGEMVVELMFTQYHTPIIHV